MTASSDETKGNKTSPPDDNRTSSKKTKLPHRPSEIREAIKGIKGVETVRLEAAPDDSIVGMDILHDGERSRDAIVRDVADLLQKKFDQHVDRQEVHVSAPGDLLERLARAESFRRVRFKKMSLHVLRDGVEAEVELLTGKREWVGKAQSGAEPTAWSPLVAHATVKALRKMLPEGTHLDVTDTTVAAVAGSEAVLVAVSFAGEGRSLQLIGSVFLSGDEQRAVVYATLDAFNRIVLREVETEVFRRGAESARALPRDVADIAESLRNTQGRLG